MGVGVFAAGLTILSVKLWTVLDKKRKAAQKRKFPGIIPGYPPLDKAWSDILSASTESSSSGSPPFPIPIQSEKQTSRFYKKRLKALRVFVRSEGHNTNWRPDFSKNSRDVLYKRIEEYRTSLADIPLTPNITWQTNSLAFDIFLYLAKVKTGQFPTLTVLSPNIFLGDYLIVLNHLKSGEEKTPTSL